VPRGILPACVVICVTISMPPSYGSSADFFTLAPCRIIDTRLEQQPLRPGFNRVLAGLEKCDVPPTATAIAVNITAISPTAAGHLTIWPSAQPRPPSSVINFAPKVTRANNGIVALSSNGLGEVSVQASLTTLDGRVDLVVDVMGYFQPASPPCRGMNLSQDQIEAAVAGALEGIPHPQSENFTSVLAKAGAQLECSFFEQPKASGSDTLPVSSTELPNTTDCDNAYCSYVQYCGPGTSLTLPVLGDLKVSDCLNRTCFEHDRCYANSCVSSSCNFSGRSHTQSCDAPFYSVCEVGACADGSRLNEVDVSVCEIAKAGPRRATPPQCGFQPCAYNGATCDPSTRKCSGTGGIVAGSYCLTFGQLEGWNGTARSEYTHTTATCVEPPVSSHSSERYVYTGFSLGIAAVATKCQDGNWKVTTERGTFRGTECGDEGTTFYSVSSSGLLTGGFDVSESCYAKQDDGAYNSTQASRSSGYVIDLESQQTFGSYLQTYNSSGIYYYYPAVPCSYNNQQSYWATWSDSIQVYRCSYDQPCN
jgi:hypothetical protein